MKLRNTMAKLLLLCIAAVASVSCDEEIEFNGEYSGEKIVLFSSVNPDSELMEVILGRSRFFLSAEKEYGPRRLSGASVKVQTPEGNVLLHEVEGEPGRYTAPLQLREGEQVSISASFEGLDEVSSTIRVPYRPDFEIVSRYEKVVEQGDRYRRVEKHFRIRIKDNPDRKEYYRFRIHSTEGSNYIASLFTMTSDVAFIDSDNLENVIERGNVSDLLYDESVLGGGDRIIDFWTTDYQTILSETGSGDEQYLSSLGTLCFSIYSYSEDLFRYLMSLKAYSELNGFGEIFGEPVCIHSNIENGIGCFGAISVRTLY
ncbi:MAG: DUF4249 domain-containing protein [Candidatus Cryptobacteroides sp.]